jgi:hypothetical protein
MYRDLIKAYMEDQSKEEELDDEVASLNKKDDPKSPEPKSPRAMLKDFDKTPVDYHYWSKKK